MIAIQEFASALECSPTEICFLLRTCDEDLKSRGDFQWPSSGLVSVPDWDPKPECGNGLHGLLSGEGDGSLLSKKNTAKWMVIAVVKSEVVQIDSKVKVPKAYVVFVGSKKDATDMIVKLCPGSACAFATVTSGEYGHSISGYSGHSTSRDYGHSTSGYYGRSTSGYSGHSISGDLGHSTSGYSGRSTSGYYGHSISGDYGHSTSGNSGHSTSGESGHSISGDCGHSTSGYYGRSTSGYSGHSISGEYGHSISGDCGYSISGDLGHSTSGYSGRSTSGYYGHSISGNFGHSISGDCGHSTSGYYGHSTSGENGIVQFDYLENGRKRIKILYVGEDNIKAWHIYFLNYKYEVEDKGHGPSLMIEAAMKFLSS